MSSPTTISRDGALNEAYRIAKGDTLLTKDLVAWDLKSGAVTINVLPIIPLEAQAVYGMFLLLI